MRLVVLPSGLVTPARTAAEPPDTSVDAPVYPSPGRRIICDLAPAPRMAVTAAWTDPAHEFNNPWVFTVGYVSTRPKTQGEIFILSCGSFIRPITTFSSAAYLVANCFQRSAKSALVGPPVAPMTAPFQRA